MNLRQAAEAVVGQHYGRHVTAEFWDAVDDLRDALSQPDPLDEAVEAELQGVCMTLADELWRGGVINLGDEEVARHIESRIRPLLILGKLEAGATQERWINRRVNEDGVALVDCPNCGATHIDDEEATK